MGDQSKNILIGLFVMAACAIIIFMILFLHPTVGDDAQMLRIRFADIDKVNIGTRVTYGGKPVGEVIEIRDIQNPGQERDGKEGYIYLYELLLTVDSRVKIYNSDNISLRTSGLLGEKSIEISPEPVDPGTPIRLVNEEVLYANEKGSVEETLKELQKIGTKIDSSLTAFEHAFDELDKRKFWEKLSRTAGNLADITSELNQPNKWKRLMDGAVAAVEGFSATAASFKEAGDAFKAVGVQVQSGEGTVGRLFYKDDAYLRMNALLSKLETVGDDINHYGILFHTDKGWQRLRARRANLLYNLCSPQEFSNFFNDEMDEVNTSLARVSNLVQEIDCAPMCDSLASDDNFKKVFAELLRKVDGLQKSLEMFNQQLDDYETCKTEIR